MTKSVLALLAGAALAASAVYAQGQNSPSGEDRSRYGADQVPAAPAGDQSPTRAQDTVTPPPGGEASVTRCPILSHACLHR